MANDKDYMAHIRKVQIEDNLIDAIEATRGEPGISLERIGMIIKENLAKEELESLIEYLRI